MRDGADHGNSGWDVNIDPKMEDVRSEIHTNFRRSFKEELDSKPKQSVYHGAFASSSGANANAAAKAVMSAAVASE